MIVVQKYTISEYNLKQVPDVGQKCTTIGCCSKNMADVVQFCTMCRESFPLACGYPG